MCQLETKDPEVPDFVYTRTQVPFKTTIAQVTRDPCNNPDNFRKPQPGNIWPSLQKTAIQPSFRPPVSNIAFGDQRIDPFVTTYNVVYRAPFPEHERIRSPNRNEDLMKTTADMRDIYKSAYNRVGE